MRVVAGPTIASLAASSALVVAAAVTAPSAQAAKSPVLPVPTSYPVGDHVRSGWLKNSTALGAPAGPEVPVTAFGQTGYIQQYPGAHELVASTFGVVDVSGAMKAAFGTNVLPLGWPTTSAYPVAGVGGFSGFEQDFSTSTSGSKTGQLTYRSGSAAPAYFVGGALFTRFSHTGGMTAHGWPTANQSYLGRCGEWVQHFTRSSTLYADARFCPASRYVQPQQTQVSAGAGYTLGYRFNGSAVYFAQRALGIASSGMSTTIGPRTSAAIKSFQRSHRQPVTGAINLATWNALRTGMPFSTGTWSKPSNVTTYSTAAVRRAAMVSYAKSMVGKPYVWGGTGNTGTSVGFDCAGLVLQAIRAAGIHPLRATNWFDVHPPSDLSRVLWQDPELQHVSTRSLLPGDLVFYGNSTTVHHVSVYIGGGQAVNAVGTRVQTLPVWNTSGWPTIYGAVRPVSTTGSSPSGVEVPATARANSLNAVPTGPVTVNDVAPSLMIDGKPFAPVTTKLSGRTVQASADQIARTGAVATVRPGDRLAGIPSGSVTVWIGSGFVLGMSMSTSTTATAPKGATQALVLSRGDAAGIGIDSQVSKA